MPWSRGRKIAVVALSALGSLALWVAVLGALVWLAWDQHEFGPRDPRYYVFVYGTQLAQVGIFEPEPGTLEYAAQVRDGTAAPWVTARYGTRAQPKDLIARFIDRCKAIGLQIKERDTVPAEGFHHAACGREGDDEHLLRIAVRTKGGTEVLLSEDINDEAYSQR